MSGLEALPWRGPGPGRPDELALPPERLRLRHRGANRKRWRYLGAFCEELMVCAARVQVGPASQTFWAIWDREGRRLHESTRLRPPGGRGEVWVEGAGADGLGSARDETSVVRIDAGAGAERVRATLRLGDASWVECVCPNGEGSYVWTRKRADVPVECDVRLGERRLRASGRGVEDESAGYHRRHTVWSWSAGVGTSTDGRSVGWNLVSGVNDPPQRSERAIWLDGAPFEPGPVTFSGLDAIAFDDGSRLEFAGECERARSENRLVVRYSYRQPFGTFAGALPGGLELRHGFGVMESHDALW